MTTSVNTDEFVKSRYSEASLKTVPELCCPVTYDAKYLEAIPAEILDRDYGCGNPAPYVRPGDTVVDLGSGGGKLCYIMAQMVGPNGRVIGVDMNPDMLQLARKYQSEVAQRIGYDNVEFRFGRIQDLAVDLEELADQISSLANGGPEGAARIMSLPEEIRHSDPMIPDNSVDCVVSNCVLNLVRSHDREQLFHEIFRVLKPGGRVAISDIVSDEDVPEDMQRDPELWSGCISGAWREDRFVNEFVTAGFQGVQIDSRQPQPWRVVRGIEFRSVTILAYKPFGDVCLEKKQAVIYRGPFAHVTDDDGHTYPRGVPMAVCEKTFHILSEQGLREHFYHLEPAEPIDDESARLFDCSTDRRREAKELKGAKMELPMAESDSCCGSNGTGCC